MDDLRTESMGFRTTEKIKSRVEQEAKERRWSMADVINFALEERYGLAPEPIQPSEQRAQG